VHHRVRKAIDRGYLVNREEKRGMPARIALADPLPEEIAILPDPEVLECWSADGGVKEEEESEEGEESKDPSPLPPNPSSNTPTVPSDFDAVLEERAAQGSPTNGYRPPRGKGWHLAGDQPQAKARAVVFVKEVWPPALGPPGDDIFDLDPGWR